MSVVAFDHVCGVDEFPNFRRVLEEGRKLPQLFHQEQTMSGYLAPQTSSKRSSSRSASGSCRCFVNGLQIDGNFLEILVRNVAGGVSNLVNDTLLDLGFRITSGNRFGEAIQVIYADDEDILNAAVSQVIQYREPELGGFILTYPHAQHILVPVQIDCSIDQSPMCSPQPSYDFHFTGFRSLHKVFYRLA
ncbi:hypothetical protein D3C72_1369730 [compost metagenome]